MWAQDETGCLAQESWSSNPQHLWLLLRWKVMWKTRIWMRPGKTAVSLSWWNWPNKPTTWLEASCLRTFLCLYNPAAWPVDQTKVALELGMVSLGGPWLCPQGGRTTDFNGATALRWSYARASLYTRLWKTVRVVLLWISPPLSCFLFPGTETGQGTKISSNFCRS